MKSLTKPIGEKKDAILFQIVELLSKHLNVSRIYLVGKRCLVKRVNSNFLTSAQETVLEIHFDLLVLTIQSYPNGIATINDLLKKHFSDNFEATIYLHREIHMQQLSEKQHFFFYKIIRPEFLIFQNNDFYFKPLRFSESRVPIDYLVDFWGVKYSASLAFLDAVNGVKNPKESGVVLFNLHQIAEQICLGLIAVFMNYYPLYFQLDYLFKICNQFTDLATKLFTPANDIERRAFELLNRNSSHIRRDQPLLLDELEIQLLKETLHLFVMESSTIVTKRINMYKSM